MELFPFPWRSLDIRTLRYNLLEPVILLYMVSIWMQFNLFQPLLFQKSCSRIFRNDSLCQLLTENETAYEAEATVVHEKSSQLLFYSNLCLTIPSIFLAPFLGTWGDRFGRKIPALLPAIGALLSALNYALCAGIANAPEELLLLSNFFQGITGGFTGCILAVSSWASHISALRTRTSRLGFVEFANLLGTSIAPAIGGVTAKYGGYPLAFGIAGSLNVFLVLYLVFFLREPESQLEKRSGLRASCQEMWSLEFIKEMISLVRWIWNDARARTCIFVAGVCLAVTWTVSTGTNEVRYLFIRTLNLRWDVLDYNLFAAEDAFVRGLTLITVLPVLKHHLALRDFSVLILGFASKMVMFIIFAVSFNTVMIFLAVVAGFLAATVSACGRSACSKSVQRSDQGKLFALLAILENLSSLLGSLIFQNVYRATRSWFPGFVYALAGGMLSYRLPWYCLFLLLLLAMDHDERADNFRLFRRFFRAIRDYDAKSEVEHNILVSEEDCIEEPVFSHLGSEVRTASVTL